MNENKKTPQDMRDLGELLLEKLSQGEKNINQIRTEVGLEPIECTEFDTLYLKKELLNNNG